MSSEGREFGLTTELEHYFTKWFTYSCLKEDFNVKCVLFICGFVPDNM